MFTMKAGVWLGLLLSLLAGASVAVDNPEAPDYVGEFRKRASVYEKKTEQAATTLAAAQRYGEYEKFLDKELNAAYALLLGKLPAAQQVQLKEAQRQWLQYRDAEFALIAANSTPENFGSSAALSRGAHRAGVIDSRIMQLLAYSRSH